MKVESIARRLPTLLPSAARAARVGFDRRFQAWLSRVAGLEEAQVVPQRPPTELLSLDIRCAHGSADVALDPAQWPALQMAVNLSDAGFARDVTDALLAPLARHFAPLLPGAKVNAVRRYPSQAVAACALPCVRHAQGEVSLVRLDSPLAAHLGALLRDGVAPDLGRLSALHVPMRITLFERLIRRQRLRGLAAGDVVLCGAARRRGSHWRATLKFGLGITMQAQANLDIDQSQAHLAAPPGLVDEGAVPGAADLPSAPSGLEDLQLPVAFEIDSARVSLGELASLGEGSVIELDVTLLEASVRLVCHGQTLGLGQLVAVGDQLGVRIVRMGVAP
ncbi:MAG TPA: FliM/FliN family flagellar motor switch protein [Roseateles sp.]